VADIVADTLFTSRTVTVRDTRCKGTCKHESPEECARSTQLVFAYRGVYVRHVDQDQAVAEANQVLFFNAYQGYRVSHPVVGGDASLTLVISEPQLHELARRDLLDAGPGVIFRPMRLRIDARTQALVALLRHSLRQHIAEPLESESLALTLVQRPLGPRTARQPGASAGRQRLVDRAKLVLAGDLARRRARPARR
jgi:AraC family transcriptional regulator